jgi:hypothetical protein
MSDPFDIVVECDTSEQVWSVLLDINNNQLPKGVKKPFASLLMTWMVQHSDDEVFAMVRGKTVRQLLSEYGSETPPKPLESGEKDGVKWALFAPPEQPPAS